MFNIVFQSLFFFLPAYISNAVPVFLEKMRWFEFLKVPVDFGYKLNGNYLFGSTKTFRGIIGGTIGGILIIYLQSLAYIYIPGVQGWFLLSYDLPNILLLGFLLGTGEGLGDLIKSFFKRRMKLASSAPCFPLDQTSFLGALVLSLIYFPISALHILSILIISPLVPFIANLLAYKVGWKKVWW